MLLFLWYGETESSWYCDHYMAYYTSPKWHVMIVEQSVECGLAGKTDVLGEKTCPSVTLSTTNPTWLTRALTRAAAVGSRRLTACAMARLLCWCNRTGSSVEFNFGWFGVIVTLYCNKLKFASLLLSESLQEAAYFYAFISNFLTWAVYMKKLRTMLQAGRSQIRFRLRSFDFLVDLILPAGLWS
jgi:hypothetical protein